MVINSRIKLATGIFFLGITAMLYRLINNPIAHWIILGIVGLCIYTLVGAFVFGVLDKKWSRYRDGIKSLHDGAWIAGMLWPLAVPALFLFHFSKWPGYIIIGILDDVATIGGKLPEEKPKQSLQKNIDNGRY